MINYYSYCFLFPAYSPFLQQRMATQDCCQWFEDMGKEEEQKFTSMDSRNNVCMLCSCSSILPGILTLKYFIVLNHALPGTHLLSTNIMVFGFYFFLRKLLIFSSSPFCCHNGILKLSH